MSPTNSKRVLLQTHRDMLIEIYIYIFFFKNIDLPRLAEDAGILGRSNSYMFDL